MRTCCTCGLTKPLDAFAFRSKEEGTRHTKCKTCVAEYSRHYLSVNQERKQEYQKSYYRENRKGLLEQKRSYYERNRNKMKVVNATRYQANKEQERQWARDRYWKDPTARKEYQKRRNRMVKTAVLAAYGAGVCVCCGEANEMFLSLDHINGCGIKRRNEEGRGSQFYFRLMKKGFPKMDLQVLCFNCNLGRKVNGGVCPHVSAQKPVEEVA